MPGPRRRPAEPAPDPTIAILSKADPKPTDADDTVRRMYTAAGEFTAFEERFGLRLVRLFDMSELTAVAHYRPGEERRTEWTGRCSHLHWDAIGVGDVVDNRLDHRVGRRSVGAPSDVRGRIDPRIVQRNDLYGLVGEESITRRL